MFSISTVKKKPALWFSHTIARTCLVLAFAFSVAPASCQRSRTVALLGGRGHRGLHGTNYQVRQCDKLVFLNRVRPLAAYDDDPKKGKKKKKNYSLDGGGRVGRNWSRRTKRHRIDWHSIHVLLLYFPLPTSRMSICQEKKKKKKKKLARDDA